MQLKFPALVYESHPLQNFFQLLINLYLVLFTKFILFLDQYKFIYNTVLKTNSAIIIPFVMVPSNIRF